MEGIQWWCASQGTAWSWSWQPYPGVWAFVLLVASVRVVLARRFVPEGGGGEDDASDSDPWPWAYWVGWASLWIALDWPVGALGAGYLASVHMVQFLLIGLLVPPLLLLGIPGGAYRALERRPVLHRVLGAVTHPVPALIIFGVVLGVTHWPPVVDTLMATQLGSFTLDLAWLGGGLVFWWPVAAAAPRRSWFGRPMKMGYLFLATIVNTAPFIFLLFSRHPVYAIYELAPPISGITSREDQILAGLLMKMGGAVVLWSAITILFGRWYFFSEQEEAAGA